MLQGRKIILGITGSIAAYKAALLTRLLVKEGAEVQVIMTPSAKDFITPLTLSTLSNKPVLSEFFKDKTWNNHVTLGKWADLMIVAPTSAHTLAKFAHGLCNNLLTAVYLSTQCPVFIAPAMDLDMYAHASTVENLKKLQAYGNHIMEAEKGPLASGLVGQGRMVEPAYIVEIVQGFLRQKKLLANKKVVITAGPTHEPIDPVRFIGNRSSGKMGFELATCMAQQGAEVILISGPTQLTTNHPNIYPHKVDTAEAMYHTCVEHFPQCDIAIFAAAVADFTPKQTSTQKIKKASVNFQLELVSTKDIAKELGKKKKPHQYIVGFSLETEDELSNAYKKLKAKNFDLIVLNSCNDEGAGFDYDTNKVTLIDKKHHITSMALKSKRCIAQDIVAMIIKNSKN